MASHHRHHHDPDKSKTRLPIGGGYLFTPPENTVDSFSHQEDESGHEHTIETWRKEVQPALLPPIVHTPPASPRASSLPSITSATGYGVHDSPLFPQQARSERAHSQQPLFERNRSVSPSPTQITEHLQSPHALETGAPNRKPRSQIFPYNLNISTPEAAWEYYQARMEELQRMRACELPKPKKSPSWNLHNEDVRQLQSLTRSAAVTKSRSAPRPASKPKAALAASPLKPTPPKRRTPKARTLNDFVDSAFPPKEPTTKHKRAPPSKKVDSENVSWTELPDFAPPASDLDSNPKTLKVSWHGHVLPLIDDPDQAHLHDQEVQVASTLRLNCATYLTNKRKIFQARVQALKDGKNFTKTAAQSACKIDVNKASQLWEAFERVGWFNAEWFSQYV